MILAAIIGILVGIILGYYIKSRKTITVTDTFVPNQSRGEYMQAQDAVMQLKNEIAHCGAIKIEKAENNQLKVSLKLVK